MSISEEAHAVAVKARLNEVLGALSTPRAAYDSDELASLSTLPAAYVEVTVVRRYVEGGPRGDGERTNAGFRTVARAVAQTVTNARLLHAKCSEALEFQELTVGGSTTTPLEFETAEPVGPDDGWYSGAHVWTHAIVTDPA